MRLALLLAVLALNGCSLFVPRPPAPETARYEQSSFSALPGWPSAALHESLGAFLAGCPRVPAFALACALGAYVPPDDDRAAQQFFEALFSPYAIVSSTAGDTGLITGYYEPIIAGSRTRTDVFRYPVLGVPEDLLVVDLGPVNPDLRNMRLRGRLEGRRVVPYYSRAEIEARGDAFPAPVLAWAADPVELFFMQIQGSGQIELPDGARMRVGYADQNGYPFRSLGRYLVDRGALTLEQASMAGIKGWARSHPQDLQEALDANPSYVFFREMPAQGGPVGALGVPLTPQYSMAVDRRFVPLGAPVYLATTFPASQAPLERLLAAQDSGGAIRGAVRADFYWGTGPAAGNFAGAMRQPGKLWLLWPRGVPLP